MRNPDGSVVVMISNHAVKTIADNNGAGSPRDVTIDVSALGNFATATQLTIDGTTSLVNGPTAQMLTFAPQMTVSFTGYGVVFLRFQ